MNKEVVMLIVFGVREYDTFHVQENATHDCGASHQFRSARLLYSVLRMDLLQMHKRLFAYVCQHAPRVSTGLVE
jgi:hypothetical protein